MASIFQKILASLARITIRRYRPIIIGITGSVGKTSTREAIFSIIKEKSRVRESAKNYNNEIGLPLTILGIPHCGKNPVLWAIWLLKALWMDILTHNRLYPEVLVLEYGVDRPGDMDYLLSIVRPRIAVVTAIGEIPVHVEFFADPGELIREKSKLVHAVPQNGIVILNRDDKAVWGMREYAASPVYTFGTDPDADIRISGYALETRADEEFGIMPDGVSFLIAFRGREERIRLHNTFGMPQVYAAAAGSASAIALGMRMSDISKGLSDFNPPPGRLRILRGIKKTLILDDTYNAAPEAMRGALDTLLALPGTRKIAVLGDMLELGSYTERAHREIGRRAAHSVNMLFCVGARAKFIADEARIASANGAHPLSHDAIKVFDDPESAGRELKLALAPGDLVLFKASQGIRMERAVIEIMEHPERAEEFLARQERYWKK